MKQGRAGGWRAHWRALPDLRGAAAFLRYVGREFLADDCMDTAASLAYTTLLSLVPLLAVVFGVLSAFPAFRELQAGIEQFIFNNFVPALGETVRGYLLQFAAKARTLTAAGFAFLVLTALALMATIETAFNGIWRVRVRRRRLTTFLIYWAVLTLGPLLVGTGLAVSSYLASLPLLSDVDQSLGLRGKALGVMPFASTYLALVLVYRLVPNRDVPASHALVGGLAGAVLFELAKRGFGYYVTNFPTQEAVYGTFATIPVFLLWIYLSWLIVLLGAELTRCFTTWPATRRNRAGQQLDSAFLDGFAVVARLAWARVDGRALSERELLALEPGLDYRRIDRVLGRLSEASWLLRTEGSRWVLARDPGTVKLLDLYRLLPGPLPTTLPTRGDGSLACLEPVFKRQVEDLAAALDVDIASLLQPDGSPSTPAVSCGN